MDGLEEGKDVKRELRVVLFISSEKITQNSSNQNVK